MGIAYNPFSLEGKTILVTGASYGIGQETAIQCSKMGAKVIVTARHEERLKETISQLETCSLNNGVNISHTWMSGQVQVCLAADTYYFQ